MRRILNNNKEWLDRFNHLLTFVGYFGIMTAGTIATFAQSEVVEAAVGVVWAYVWSVFLILGGLLSLIGLRRFFLLEVSGLPMIASSLLVYGVLLCSISEDNKPRLAFGILLIATSSWFIARVFELLHDVAIINAVREIEEHGKRE